MDTAQCILHQFVNKFDLKSPLYDNTLNIWISLKLFTCSMMLWWEHQNNRVTSEAQLKLLHHSGEGLGHQSNTGVINELDLFWDQKYPIVLENVLGLRSVRFEGLAVTGLNSEWSSHLSMKEIIHLCLVQQTDKISLRVGLMLQLNCLNSVQKYVYTQQNP